MHRARSQSCVIYKSQQTRVVQVHSTASDWLANDLCIVVWERYVISAVQCSFHTHTHCSRIVFAINCFITALHGMQTRSSDENSVCPQCICAVRTKFQQNLAMWHWVIDDSTNFPRTFFGMGQNRSPNFSEMGPNYTRSHSTFEVFDMSLRFETTELVQVDWAQTSTPYFGLFHLFCPPPLHRQERRLREG